MGLRLLEEIKNADSKQLIRGVLKGFKNMIELLNPRGVLFELSRTSNSIILSALTLKAVGSENVHAVYFIDKGRYRIPKSIERLIKYLKIKVEFIELTTAIRDLRSYFSSYMELSDEYIRGALAALILRYKADKNKYALVCDVDRTQWLCGQFNHLYTGVCDFLPLVGVYYTQLSKIASALHVNPFLREVEEPIGIVKIKESLGVQVLDYVDAILLGITRNKSDEEILREVGERDVDVETVRKVRALFNDGLIRRKSGFHPLSELSV